MRASTGLESFPSGAMHATLQQAVLDWMMSPFPFTKPEFEAQCSQMQPLAYVSLTSSTEA